MSDMSEIRVHERRRIVFPARLHVHNHIENVVGLDLSEGGCRIRCKRPVNIFSKVLQNFLKIVFVNLVYP